jgi:hypothetical protein
MLKTFKYLVQPVLLDLNDEGEPFREIPGEVASLFNREQIEEFISNVENRVAEANLNGGLEFLVNGKS